jgi:ketosteroid isomerase-like protein
MTRPLATGLPGGHSEWEPPDPFPNSEVKTPCADASVDFVDVKVGHCQALDLMQTGETPDGKPPGVFLLCAICEHPWQCGQFVGRRSVLMNLKASVAQDPQDLERLWISRQRAGDVEGMVALYEPDAILDHGGAQPAVGRNSIRIVCAQLVASGRKYELGTQQAAMVSGDLALTSTRALNGSVTAEVARRQSDGTWLWVIDRFSIA